MARASVVLLTVGLLHCVILSTDDIIGSITLAVLSHLLCWLQHTKTQSGIEPGSKTSALACLNSGPQRVWPTRRETTVVLQGVAALL